MIDYPPRGLIANLITPMDERGRPDIMALDRLIRHLRGEVDAFLAGSVRIGETLQLDHKERLAILDTAVQACSKEMPLFFEITCPRDEETVKLLEGAERLLEERGVTGQVFYLITPLVYHGNRELPRHLLDLGQISRRRFVVGNNPDLVRTIRTRLRHKDIRTAVLKKIAGNEQVVGLEFDGDLARAINYQRALRGRSGFRFYDGNEDNFVQRPSSSGLISAGANLLPRAWSDVVRSSLNIFDDQRMYPDHLHRIWRSGHMVRSLLNLYRPNPAAFIKITLKLTGVIPGDTVAENTPGLTREQADHAAGQLGEMQLI